MVIEVSTQEISYAYSGVEGSGRVPAGTYKRPIMPYVLLIAEGLDITNLVVVKGHGERLSGGMSLSSSKLICFSQLGRLRAQYALCGTFRDGPVRQDDIGEFIYSVCLEEGL
jgi:hypothetical protein